MPDLPRSIYSKGLDSLANLFLKNTDPIDERIVKRLITAELLSNGEALVISPTVSFKTYGENLPLVLLTRAFGVSGIRTLLEEGGIEFVLWRPLVTHLVEPIDGVNPLATGDLESDAHSDPLASAELGFKGWAPEIAAQDARVLAKLAADRTVLPRKKVAHEVVGKVYATYEQGALDRFGFDPATPLPELDLEERKLLTQLCERGVEAAVLFETETDLYEGSDIWDTLLALCNRLQSNGLAQSTTEAVLSIERLPSISTLLLKKIITFEDLISLRNRPETKEFRDWLWSQPCLEDSNSVVEDYLSKMAPRVDRKDRTWFKSAKIIGVSLLGSVLGTAVGGPMGGTAGFVAGTMAGAAVSMIDGLWIDRLLTGRNPRRFATDVLSPIVANHVARSNSQQP